MSSNLSGLTFSSYTHKGVTFFTAWHDNSYVPGGFLWGHWHYGLVEDNTAVPTRFDVIGCYTAAGWKRRGLMTAMIMQLFDEPTCECVCTDDGTADGGKQLMAAMGFKRSEDTGIWYLKRSDATK